MGTKITSPARALRRIPRLRRRLVIIAAALGFVTVGAVPFAASSAQASDPCVHPQVKVSPRVLCPPPSPSTTSPPPTTTPPPTTVPTGPTFSTAISVLDQSGTGFGFGPSIVGQWMAGGDFRDARRQGSVTWNDAAKSEGTLNIVNPQFLGSPPIGLSIFEPGSNGSLCRTPTTNAIPFGPGHSAHIIIAPPQLISAGQLAQLGSGVTGSFDASGKHIEIRSVQINPRDDGTIEVIADGTASEDILGITFSDNFTYEIQLLLISNKDATDPHNPIFVSSPFQGHFETHDGTGTQWSPTDSDNGDAHSAVTSRAMTAFNEAVNNDPKVAFFSTLGYLPALRDIGVSSAGISLDPTLCVFN